MSETQTTGSLIKKRAGMVPGAVPKKKKNQIGMAIAALIVVAVIGIGLSKIKPILSIAWLIGITFGVILQKSRFCFTASLRDPILTGSTSLLRATLIAFAVAIVGFGAIQFTGLLANKPLLGNINPVSLPVALGATIFGVGAVISGGCASGTLMRMGEGFAMQWISITTFILGSAIGAMHIDWWDANFIKGMPKIYLPETFGWAGGFFGSLAVLGALYVFATWFEYRNIKD